MTFVIRISYLSPRISGVRPGLFGVPGRAASIPVAGVLRIACLSLVLAGSITDVAALDLSLPKDGEGQPLSMPGQEASMAAEYRREEHSPEVSLYTDNVKETIKRRLRDSFPRDRAGRVICGEASYAMTLRPDGSIDRLEVAPMRRNIGATNDLESYFVQPTPGYRNAGSAKLSRPVATEKEELQVFAQRISELLRAIAPYPTQPKTMPDRQTGLQSQVLPVVIAGNIGVECRQWEVGR